MKATEQRLRAALDRPPADVRLYLLHGPDEAAAMAYAARLARAMGEGAERIDLDAAALKRDPALLADEAAAISLFGGARHIRVTGAGEDVLGAVAALLEADRAGNPAVVIAPGVKTSGALVKAAIASDRALAFACYAPSEQTATTLAADLLREQGVRASAGLVQRLVRAGDGDRAIMAREAEKLALYLDAAPDRPIDGDEAAFDAVGADIGEGEVDVIVQALVAGTPVPLAEALRRQGADVSAIPLLRAVVRRLAALAEMRAAIEAGEGVDQVIQRQRMHFSMAKPTAAALARWRPAALASTLARVRQLEREVMAGGAAGAVLAESVLLRLAAR